MSIKELFIFDTVFNFSLEACGSGEKRHPCFSAFHRAQHVSLESKNFHQLTAS